MNPDKYDFKDLMPSLPVDEEKEAPPTSGKVTSPIITVDRRGPGHTVFHVDEATFSTTQPRTSHWSIAWSDLMMTMFVLFLSMFVYKMADEEFLKEGGMEILGGDTTEALQIIEDEATLPFPPIKGGPPLIATGAIKKIEPVPTREEEFSPPSPPASQEGEEFTSTQPPVIEEEYDITSIFDQELERPASIQPETTPETATVKREESKTVEPDSFQEIYKLSKGALETNNLDEFAAIDIIPDKTVRIILTGDLLFSLGKSDLSDQAKTSLTKIAGVIRHTPYMINVVGHTDNIPMSSIRFKNNWELSLARANTVAQFLIHNIGMNPNQFVVSGYSSYRPTVANNSTENRAKNRRVEVIISKRLPTPHPATRQNLN